MKTHIKIMAAALVTASTFIASASAASADVVFENGVDGQFCCGNNPFTYEVVTQPFELSDSTTFTSLTYNAFTVVGDTVPVSNVFVEFLDANNQSVFSGNYSVSNTRAIGGTGYYQFTDYTIDLPTTTLAAGQWSLGLQVSPQQWNEHWSVPQNYQDMTAGSDNFPHYFRLEDGISSAVPEPQSWALMVLGVGGLGGTLRSRRQVLQNPATA